MSKPFLLFKLNKEQHNQGPKHGLCLMVTCHRIKKLISLQVGEGGEAAGAPEGGTTCRVSLICLNAPSHVVQFILYHIDQYPLKQFKKNFVVHKSNC